MTHPTRLRIPQPDDWHLHLRQGELLRAVLPHTTRHFARAIVMPNLTPPVISHADVIRYRQEITAALPHDCDFQPLMTLYLTEQTRPDDLQAAHDNGDAIAAKLYPAGATTNSAAGVRQIDKIHPVLDTMQTIGMPLLIHGEVVDPDIDIFDREAVFIERILIPLRRHFPELKIVLEHITTKEGVDYIQSCDHHTAATITPHHLVINRNAMLVGGIKPHYYCLPVVKRESHRLALRRAATSGDPRFFLGTDSAPHLDSAKESACGCAGIFNAANAVPIVTQVFEQENALDKLEGFTSRHGPAFYNLPVNAQTLELRRHTEPQPQPEKLQLPTGQLTPFDPIMPVHWEASRKTGQSTEQSQ